MEKKKKDHDCRNRAEHTFKTYTGLTFYFVGHHDLGLELPHSANNNTGCSVKFEFQISNRKFLV